MPGGTILRPDLVIKHRETAALVEVTLLYENKESLQEAAYTKVCKYLPEFPTIQDDRQILLDIARMVLRLSLIHI